MNAKSLPAARGWAWLVEGWQLWFKSPLVLSVTAMTFLFLVMVASSIRYVGPLLASLLMPPLSVGMYIVCRAVDLKENPKPVKLFDGFRQHLQSLFVLGAIHFTIALAILAISGLFDNGALLGVMTGTLPPDPKLPASSQYALLFTLVLMMPLMMAYWFAPQLVGLRGLSPVKALFFSLVASWRNMRALFVFSAGALFVFMLLPALLSGLFSLIAPALSALVLGLLVFVVLPVFQTAYYVNVQDVFGDIGLDEPKR